MAAEKPRSCLHCVDAINAHGAAHPDVCHCERCVIEALGRCVGEVLAGDTDELPPSTAKH